MADYMDWFNIYIMGNVQILTGFHFLTRLLQKKAGISSYLLCAVCWEAMTWLLPGGRLWEYGICIILFTVSGMLICRADFQSVLLYSALTIEVMHLCFGIVDSVLGIFYPFLSVFDRKLVGIALMLFGDAAALALSVFCYRIVCRFFSYYETVKKQYVLVILIPVLLIFFMGEYIASVVFRAGNNPDYRVFLIRLLGMASLFCILFAYRKLLQNFLLCTKLSLLEQEEHALVRYVEEAKARYEDTKSFRHDIRNHITVVKELLQNGKWEQALNYMEDMEGMARELSFPCSTNNPVADILAGNKLGLAVRMGIDVDCSLVLPYPCSLRDIDICIILSNALDNAIHACLKKDGGEKYIRLTGRIQGDFILIEIENSYEKDGPFREGTGLANIRAVAEKYHGSMSIKTEGTTFVLSVLLIIPQH